MSQHGNLIKLSKWYYLIFIDIKTLKFLLTKIYLLFLISPKYSILILFILENIFRLTLFSWTDIKFYIPFYDFVHNLTGIDQANSYIQIIIFYPYNFDILTHKINLHKIKPDNFMT